MVTIYNCMVLLLLLEPMLEVVYTMDRLLRSFCFTSIVWSCSSSRGVVRDTQWGVTPLCIRGKRCVEAREMLEYQRLFLVMKHIAEDYDQSTEGVDHQRSCYAINNRRVFLKNRRILSLSPFDAISTACYSNKIIHSTRLFYP